MIRNLVEIDPLLATGGQPTADELAALGGEGFQVVINLATAQSDHAVPDEGEILARQGLAYVWIPVPWEQPELGHLDRFCHAMARCVGRKVLVHCALDKRASAFTYLYRTLCLGVPRDEAAAAMQAIWTPDGAWAALLAEAEATPRDAWGRADADLSVGASQ